LTKALPVFVSRADFSFGAPNSGAVPAGQGRAGINYVTASANFHRQVVRGNPAMIRELGAAKIRNMPVERWRTYKARRRSILFLMPPPAIGEHVAIRLFLESFIESVQPTRVALLGSDAASDVYAGMADVEVHPSWMAHDELKSFNAVIDLNDVPVRRNIEFWPVDMEAELFDLFGLPLPPQTPVAPVCPKGARPSVGVFPLASSPIRTLQPALIAALCQAAGNEIDVQVVLNRHQNQSDILRRALDNMSPNIRYIEDTGTLSDLMAQMRAVDYGVFADSGPAHLSKLDQLPGTAVYTSAPSSVLFGRHRNLMAIQSDYSGEYCKAPCGLAKLRCTVDGAVGCMGSLKVDVASLPRTVDRADAAMTARFLVDDPVPCAAAMAADADKIARAILADMRSRLAG
jgi:hypothetical protein